MSSGRVRLRQSFLNSAQQDVHPGIDVSSVDIEGEQAADGDHLARSAGSHCHEADDDDQNGSRLPQEHIGGRRRNQALQRFRVAQLQPWGPGLSASQGWRPTVKGCVVHG